MTRDLIRKWRRAPIWNYSPLGVVGLFAAAGATYVLLSVGQDACSTLGKSMEWKTWKVTAAAACAVSVVSFCLGSAAVVEAVDRGGWAGPTSSRPQRLAEAVRGERADGRAVLGYLALAVLLCAGSLQFLDAVAADRLEWEPSMEVERRVDGVVTVVALSAVPWLVMAWLLQQALLAADAGRTVARLRKQWDLLNSVLLAFAVLVVLALVPTGALRLAYNAQGTSTPARPEFPASDVLLYGGFFAALLTVIAVPVLAAYRSAARRLLADKCPLGGPEDLPEAAPAAVDAVDAGLVAVNAVDDGNPVPGTVSEAQKQAYEQMEWALHLDVGLLRSPITAFTVFVPLVTAALAAYLPQLTNK